MNTSTLIQQQLSLFATPHDQAVTDMIVLFQQQLRDSTSEQERQLIHMAIQGWESTLGPELPSSWPAKRGRAKSQQHE